MENIEMPNSEEIDELWNENPPDKLGIMSDTEISAAGAPAELPSQILPRAQEARLLPLLRQRLL